MLSLLVVFVTVDIGIVTIELVLRIVMLVTVPRLHTHILVATFALPSNIYL